MLSEETLLLLHLLTHNLLQGNNRCLICLSSPEVVLLVLEMSVESFDEDEDEEEGGQLI